MDSLQLVHAACTVVAFMFPAIRSYIAMPCSALLLTGEDMDNKNVYTVFIQEWLN